ncbi:MAG: nucleotidyl transferase AbiEii/AbiGii toxin family protein [Bacteroidales bacterium]|nr:nucleotidyl transferase AbiEii/AbiGii toxin family protein [Bacteroidales bacterium]
MTEKQIKNIGASLRAKLLNLAKQQGLDFNRMLLLYIQERFLYRLSKSIYKDRFILKGGILFYGAHKEQARSTKDIDLLARNIPNKHELFKKYFKAILSINADDGVTFFCDTITMESISEAAEYVGLRIKFKAKFDTAIINMQIDVGFSDNVIPHSILFEYPMLLANKTIKLTAYSWELVISEKFETILKLGQINSRMKDFFDIYFLQHHRNFKGEQLQSTLELTLKNRSTDIIYYKDIFSDHFRHDPNKIKQWNAFLRISALRLLCKKLNFFYCQSLWQ